MYKPFAYSIAFAALAMSNPAFAQSGASGSGSSSTGVTAGSSTTTPTMDRAAPAVTGATSNSTATWNTESTYWRNNYATRPYYNKNTSYSSYEPAYRYGVDMYSRNPGVRYDALNQEEMRRGWESARGSSSMDWNTAQAATRDAYNRMYDTSSRNSASGAAGTNSSLSPSSGSSNGSTGTSGITGSGSTNNTSGAR